jgi:predicted glycoside hydrolase/deacetylase ChbG (UPF0249 family)
MHPNPVLKKLGFSDTDRVAIIHVDDVGMCQASIAAFGELWQAGIVSCGAVMMPCPWAFEAARFARQHPEADLGIHTTLTCEWDTYRWGPLSTRDPATGLLDEEGCLPRRSEPVQENADPAAVQIELEAQIQRAISAGMHPTHADTHMGTVVHPKFIQAYLQTAIQNGLPPMMLRLDEAGWRRLVGQMADAATAEQIVAQAVQMTGMLEDMGIPLLDGMYGMPLDADPAQRFEPTKAALDSLRPGITHFIIHAAKDTPELRAIADDWACRDADYRTFLRDDLRQHIKDTGLQVIGYRALQELMPK